MCVETLSTMVSNYTSTNNGAAELIDGILRSRKFQSKFGNIFKKESQVGDSKILQSLKKDYDASKDRETSKLIQLQKGKVLEKICIGDGLKNSSFIVKNVDMEKHKSRTESAKAVGRISKYGDERRRLLSIVAWDFSQTELQEFFGCSKKTVTAARVHAILFGKGGVPRDGLVFTRQTVSPEVLEEFQLFLQSDDISRSSSCRSVLVNKQEAGVRYWQCSIKDAIQQYCLKYPNGVKRTYIYTHLPQNYRTDSMIAGLCNLCDDYGHTNFVALQLLLKKL